MLRGSSKQTQSIRSLGNKKISGLPSEWKTVFGRAYNKRHDRLNSRASGKAGRVQVSYFYPFRFLEQKPPKRHRPARKFQYFGVSGHLCRIYWYHSWSLQTLFVLSSLAILRYCRQFLPSSTKEAFSLLSFSAHTVRASIVIETARCGILTLAEETRDTYVR